MSIRNARFLAAVLLGAAIALPSYVSAQNYPASVKELVANTRKQVKSIDMAGFKSVFDAKTNALIVDVRNPDEYATGFVPGAVNVPRGLLEFTIWGEVGFPDKTDMNRKIYLYCKTGGRCTLAAKTLQDLGFTDVTAVVMVFEEWRKAGYPVEMPKK
ncbi:MAG: rhodanese-like domain-containing protein [Burkholderiaceae bacterium]|jgi:rhodanese-related sulfurtransferase|nr:rhodanese-like domain-containing protein [Burkholderiaceae bacterium]